MDHTRKDIKRVQSFCRSMGQCWTRVSVPNSVISLKFFYCDCRRVHQEIDFSTEKVHLVTTMESWESILSDASKDRKHVVAKFSASWCIPSRRITPAYCELAQKYPSITFLIVDVDELAELSTSWDIKATPTFLFLKEGRQVDKVVGDNKIELQKKTAAMANLAIGSST